MQLVFSAGLEYPWYLPYNILLNNLVVDSQCVAVSAQHVFSHIDNDGKEMQRIPDYVVIHTIVSRKINGKRAGVSSTVCTVVEIKPVFEDKSRKKTKRRNSLGAKYINVQKQSEVQACLALKLSPNQNTVIAIIAVGPDWQFTLYERVPDVMSAEGLPTITKKNNKSKKGRDDFIPLTKDASKLSNETIEQCEALKEELKRIIGEGNW